MGYIIPVIAIPVMFVASFLGSATPGLIAKANPSIEMSKTLLYFAFAGAGAGAVSAVGFIHTFPEGNESFEAAVEDGVLPEYPWGGLVAALGALLSVAMERVTLSFMSSFKRQHHHHHQTSQADENEPLTASLKRLHPETSKADENESLRQVLLEVCILLFGLALHSLFVGITVGVAENDWVLLVAVVFHQLFEGYALGAAMVKAKITSVGLLSLFDLLYAISTPAGVAVGLVVRVSVGTDSPSYAIIEGVFQTLSAGILIYLGLCHLLVEDLDHIHQIRPTRAAYSTYIVGLTVGFVGLAVVALWA